MTNVVPFPKKRTSSGTLQNISDEQSLADTSNNDEFIHQSLDQSMGQLNQEVLKITELIKLLGVQIKKSTATEDSQ